MSNISETAFIALMGEDTFEGWNDLVYSDLDKHEKVLYNSIIRELKGLYREYLEHKNGTLLVPKIEKN